MTKRRKRYEVTFEYTLDAVEKGNAATETAMINDSKSLLVTLLDLDNESVIRKVRVRSVE